MTEYYNQLWNLKKQKKRNKQKTLTLAPSPGFLVQEPWREADNVCLQSSPGESALQPGEEPAPWLMKGFKGRVHGGGGSQETSILPRGCRRGPGRLFQVEPEVLCGPLCSGHPLLHPVGAPALRRLLLWNVLSFPLGSCLVMASTPLRLLAALSVYDSVSSVVGVPFCSLFGEKM